MKLSRSIIAKAGAAALVLAAAGTASVAQARDHVYFSIGANVAPCVVLGASNYGPRYYAPAPVVVAPAPVYYESAPVYYEPYYAPAPIVGVQWVWSPEHRRYYYIDHGRRHWDNGHHRGHDHHR
jgi:hypothetical protein